MKCETTRDLDCDTHCDPALITVLPDGRKIVKSGTIIDEAIHARANCVALVRNGLGIPVDEECMKASQRTWGQIVEAQEAMRRLHTVPPVPRDDDDDEPETEDVL